MVNTKHGRFTSVFWRSLGVFLLSLPVAAQVPVVRINNGIPRETVGHFEVAVEAGGETREAIVTASRRASNDALPTDLVFDYSTLVDPGNDGFGGSLGASDAVTGPFSSNANTVTSSGSFLGFNQNVIQWIAVSSIAPGAQVMATTYTFTAQTGVLGPLRLLQYLDEDVIGPVSPSETDDVFFTTGLAGSGDLQLFTLDNLDIHGLSHSGILLPGSGGLQNASFAGWAADVFPNMRPRIMNGPGQPVSPTGMNTNNLQALGLSFQHPQLGPVFGPADIVSVLAWDVDPNAPSAVITTFLGGVPISQQAVEVRPVGNQLRCRGSNCTFQVTCNLPPSPGAVCTNRIVVTVSRNALRTSEGTSVRQRRVRFAAGAAAVPAGQTAPVRLRLRSAGRQFFRAGGRRIRGVMEIRNVAGTVTNRIRVVLRRR